MNPDYQHLMREATRLTRSGNLQAATAAIQAALAGAAPATGATHSAGGVIDVPAREVPAASSFIAGSSGSGTSRREYKLFVPPAVGTRKLPLVVMLHGCTQTADDFAAGTAMNDAALAQGFYVLYPAQSQQANPQRCWNWFKHSHQERERGEPALLAAMAREVMAQHAIDPQRVYVTGLSAGGA
ncbi:MAG: PHB depolymerase family esterase, partial [Ramlibacter sp.]